MHVNTWQRGKGGCGGWDYQAAEALIIEGFVLSAESDLKDYNECIIGPPHVLESPPSSLHKPSLFRPFSMLTHVHINEGMLTTGSSRGESGSCPASYT
jgi:hypothetical protein